MNAATQSTNDGQPSKTSSCGGMKRILAKILLVLVAAIAVFAGVVASRPAAFRISRSATMSATPAAVFAQVNDFHNWEAWSPWVKMDPNAKSTYDGPTSGTGSNFHWAGNSDVGEGSMTITESQPSDLIRLRLDFIRPMAGTADTEFTFKPDGDKTVVTWTMSGENGFIAKAFGMFVDCDKMVGDQFEKGLASMKSIVESANQQ